jgi:hypothetical protein
MPLGIRCCWGKGRAAGVARSVARSRGSSPVPRTRQVHRCQHRPVQAALVCAPHVQQQRRPRARRPRSAQLHHQRRGVPAEVAQVLLLLLRLPGRCCVFALRAAAAAAARLQPTRQRRRPAEGRLPLVSTAAAATAAAAAAAPFGGCQAPRRWRATPPGPPPATHRGKPAPAAAKAAARPACTSAASSTSTWPGEGGGRSSPACWNHSCAFCSAPRSWETAAGGRC